MGVGGKVFCFIVNWKTKKMGITERRPGVWGEKGDLSVFLAAVAATSTGGPEIPALPSLQLNHWPPASLNWMLLIKPASPQVPVNPGRPFSYLLLPFNY